MSIGSGGGGTTFETRWSCSGASPMWKSAPSGPATSLAKNWPSGQPGDAPDHLADEVTLVQRVVARCRPRLPPRRLGGEHRRRLLPVEDVVHHDRLRPGRHARRVRHQVADLDLVLAVGRELRPVLRNGRVHVEQAALDQHEGAERHHRLGGRPHVGDRVLRPRHGLGGVGPAAPQVDDGLTVERDRHRRAEIGTARKVRREVLSHRDEALVTGAMDLGHRRTSQARWTLLNLGTVVDRAELLPTQVWPDREFRHPDWRVPEG